MATTTAANEIKSLQDRVAELEKQLTALKALVHAGQPRLPTSHRAWTKEDARAYHESAQRVQKTIDRNREADRQRAAREYDRVHGRSKKVVTAPSKSAKQSTRVRRAG